MSLPFADRLRPITLVRPRFAREGADFGRWLEAGLLAVLAVQLACLFWTFASPVGGYGVWTQRQPSLPGGEARRALLSGFDPFFRAAPDAAAGGNVTGLALKLFGIQLNEASGGGSAIIAGADDVQASYAIGDEIVPGVKLKAVFFDHVLLDGGGAEESLFIDQSTPAADTPAPVNVAAPTVAPATPAQPTAAPPAAPADAPTPQPGMPTPPPPAAAQPAAGAAR